MNYKKEDILGKQCRHITYCVSDDGKDDALFVKEWIYLKDGRAIPNLRMIENMERDFWVVKPGRRTFKDKIQYIKEEDCIKNSCREIDLLRKADLALGGSGFVRTRNELFKSPYLFGCGVKPQSLVKNAYNTKWPEYRARKALAMMGDTETDVLHGTEEIIIGTMCFKEHAILIINRHFFDGTPDEIILEKLRQTIKEELGDILLQRKVKLQIELVNNAGEIAKRMLDFAHFHKPDFVSFWNINFDIKKMIEALEKYGYDIADCFSDPSVPKKYKFFKYREGPAVKTIHDGSTKNLNPEQRWHVAECPATFFFIDGMTLYYRLRMAAGLEEGYSLDAVLDRNLNITKLKMEELSHLTGIDWHKEMQAKHKYVYCAYGLFDGISTEMLDEETNDIAIKLPAQSSNSDFTDFKSDPRKTADDMHYHALKHGYVMGVVDGDVRDENDKHVVDVFDWIVTLDAYMSYDIGVKTIDLWKEE